LIAAGGCTPDFLLFDAAKPSVCGFERRYKSTEANHGEEKGSINMQLIRGPKLDFVLGRVANLTDSSVLGSSGQTVALATMATDSSEYDRDVFGQRETMDQKTLLKHFLIQKCRLASPSTMMPLTVDYRQRHHAVGKIPTNANRSDNRRPTNAETLASRAIDRALRPLLQRPQGSSSLSCEIEESAVHLTCSIQACPIAEDGASGGHPVALALNSASVALKHRLKEPVAAVYLCLMLDGRVLEDPSMSLSADGGDKNGVLCELLYAGTRDSVVMMEFAGQLEEAKVVELIQMAHECIQPRIEMQKKVNSIMLHKPSLESNNDNDIRNSLGLDRIAKKKDTESSTDCTEEQEIISKAASIYDEAFQYCKENLGDAPLRLFGVDPTKGSPIKEEPEICSIHSEEKDGPLPGKTARGRREHLVLEEIRRILQDFNPVHKETSELYNAMLEEYDSLRNVMSISIGSLLLKEAMQEAAVKYGCRADGRGTKTIRPLSIDVPALPDVVHGSAVFTRGETQVLCTTTLGPPKDGILLNDPYLLPPRDQTINNDVHSSYKDLPVGSLRYLRNQEYLESDLNSRKVKASREQTGDSGTLRERRRAFLQYDFPSYSKGEVQSGSSASASRREIGHGESFFVYRVLISSSCSPNILLIHSLVGSCVKVLWLRRVLFPFFPQPVSFPMLCV
jgi:polyribonucleotide nucleotidyltransferase